MIRRRYSRRRLLSAGGAALAGLAGGVAKPRLVFSQNKTQIKFTLPWVPEGSDLFAFTAKGMGLWDKHGRDLSPRRRRQELVDSISAWPRRPRLFCSMSKACQ